MGNHFFNILGDLEWKIITIQYSSVFHIVFYIFHTLKSNLLIVSVNMDAIIQKSKKPFPTIVLWIFFAICFRSAWVEDHYTTIPQC